jgi:anti-sigma factor RsiW
MADCQETLNELHRYLDEELSADRVEEILSHLKICSDCQEAFEFHAVLRDTIREKAQRDEISDDFLDRLKECFGGEILGDEHPEDGQPENN